MGIPAGGLPHAVSTSGGIIPSGVGAGLAPFFFLAALATAARTESEQVPNLTRSNESRTATRWMLSRRARIAARSTCSCTSGFLPQPAKLTSRATRRIRVGALGATGRCLRARGLHERPDLEAGLEQRP